MRLEIYQAYWGMEQLPGARGAWTLDEQIRHVADAGFYGMGVSFSDYTVARRVTERLRDAGLRWIALCFPTTVHELGPIIDRVFEFGAEHVDHVTLQPDLRPTTVLEGIPYILGWQQMADEAGVPLYFENHRDRMTTDLLFTLQLLDAVPSMKLIADLSHFVVAREFRWPISDENEALIRRVLQRSWAFHGRVASREQVQVQIEFPQHKPWLDVFLRWWEQGMREWRSRADRDAVITFMPELGPPMWYAMTDRDGRELSDRWEEALVLKGLVEGIWSRLEAEAGASENPDTS